MSDRLAALRMFVRVARSGSFSRAARELGTTQPTVSRLIAGLEADIGAALFTRTTRALTLTDAGVAYLDRIETLLDGLDDADSQVRGTGELRGSLRIGLSSSLANRIVIPTLPRFAEAHAGLTIDLLIDDRRHDLVVEGVDVALRFGVLPDSTAVARKIVTWRRVITASPGYLARHGTPAHPDDLAGHSAILGNSGASVGVGWTFTQAGASTTIQIGGRIRSNQNEGAVTAALAGLGIVATSFEACRREIEAGSLVQLLADWDMGSIDLHAVFAGGRAAKASARRFADFLDGALNGSAVVGR